MVVQERYQPIPAAANSTTTLTGASLAGFICTVTGTLTVTRTDGTVIVNALPVTAGAYHPLPCYINSSKGDAGGTVTLAGGAAGTILV